ncbi:MAG: transposase [Gemmatimonadetes bacterium]|nr:transposase [Gemmatimonadota bacterium]
MLAWGMYSRLFVHIVFVTAAGSAISADVPVLQGYVSRVVAEEGAAMLALGMVSTHVHLLLRLRPTTSIPRLLQRLKGGSACRVRQATGHALRWEAGYSVRSVGERGLDSARRYVEGQATRHPDQRIPGWSVE